MPYPTVTYEDVNARLAEAGVEPLAPTAIDLAHRILSVSLGTASGYRGHVNPTSVVAARMCEVSYEDGATLEVSDPLLSAVPLISIEDRHLRGWPTGRHTVDRLGLTPKDIDKLWSAAEQESERFALLPLGLVAVFFPPGIFAAVAELAAAGPASCLVRANKMLAKLATQPLSDPRARRNGKTNRSRSSTAIYEQATERLLRTIRSQAIAKYTPRTNARELAALVQKAKEAGDLSEAQRQGEKLASCHPRLAPWRDELPPLVSAVGLAEDRREDRSAPPLQVVRQAYAIRQRDLERVKRDRYRYRTRAMRRLRDRLQLVLEVLLAGRVAEIYGIRVKDIDFEHRFSDGTVGPAIRTFPVKKNKLESGKPSWKGVPAEVAEMLREWLSYSGLEHYPDRLIWISGWARRPAHEVGNGDGRATTFGVPGDAMTFAGFRGQNDPRKKAVLVPFGDGRPGGYANHRLRHFGEQLARRVGHEWIEAHPEWKGRISDQVFADALTDHSFGAADKLGYNDLEHHRDVFTREAIAGIWELVFGEAGARRAPDVSAIREAENARDRVQAEITAIEDQIGELRRQLTALTGDQRPSADAPAPNDDADGPTLTRALLALTQDLRRMHERDRLERRQIAAINAELLEATDLRDELRRDLARAQARLDAAHERTVPVDDLLSDEDYQTLVDAASKITREEPEVPDLEILHDTLPLKRFAQAVGVSEPTMRRWAAKRSCAYWSPENYDQIVIEFSERRREVMIERLDHSKIAPGAMREIRRLQSEAA